MSSSRLNIKEKNVANNKSETYNDNHKTFSMTKKKEIKGSFINCVMFSLLLRYITFQDLKIVASFMNGPKYTHFYFPIFTPTHIIISFYSLGFNFHQHYWRYVMIFLIMCLLH